MNIKKELWFGLIIMGLIIAGTGVMLLSADKITNGHLGLMMLALVVVAIMMGFPTAFTLMGMGMIFTWLAYEENTTKTLDLMVQSAFKVMSNDVLISIPLFVFMGYLVERANLIEKLFRSLHLSLARVPGSLAVATLFTCAVFATATGIVGAVVTLMGLLALPQMLKGGYDVRLSAGAITAGGCLGILIPPSVLLIVYGATAGVSVVQLYAGAFFPGIMLAGLYILYVIIVAKLKPELAPPLSEQARFIPLPAFTQQISDAVSNRALPALLKSLKGARNVNVPTGYILKELFITLLPAIVFVLVAFMSWRVATAPLEVDDMPAAMESSGGMMSLESPSGSSGGLAEPPGAGGLAEPPAARSGLQEPPSSGGGLQEPPGASAGGLQEPPGARGGVQEPPGAGGGVQEPPGAAVGVKEPPGSGGVQEPPGAVAAPTSGVGAGGVGAPPAPAEPERRPASTGFWVGLGIGVVALVAFYGIMSFQRLEVFKMLLSSFFPLVVLILAVLGSIVFGLATPTEAAAVGAFGGFVLAAA
ncbi:MAG: TRAP transporter large permease subunit, partial [Betaproteobacteria bacterium]